MLMACRTSSRFFFPTGEVQCCFGRTRTTFHMCFVAATNVYVRGQARDSFGLLRARVVDRIVYAIIILIIIIIVRSVWR
jgi:hypothetical protein